MGREGGYSEGGRMDVLATLIDAHVPYGAAGFTSKDMKQIIGRRTRIAEVLNRRRGLSIIMIRRLHKRLGISAQMLIRPSRKRAA
jgi:HTH-type transcriptional regulator/antitoxin HigA